MKININLGLTSHAEVQPTSQARTCLNQSAFRISKRIFFFLFCIFISPIAQASHAVGGEIKYEYLGTTSGGSKQYTVTLTVYRDCAGITLAGLTQTLNYTNPGGNGFAGFNGSFTVTRTAIIDRSILCPGQISNCNGGTQPGVQEYIFVGTMTIPSSPNFTTVSYSLCCRANGITTLATPGNENLYLSTTVNSSIINSSPSFLNLPIGNFCHNQPAALSLNAFDTDGDAIVYSLIAAREGNNNPVEYAVGFSGTNPITSSTGVTINPNTGVISFTPTVLNQRALVSVKAEEYRGGVKIGEISRDIEITVINCSGNIAPVIAPINNAVVQVGQTLCIPVNVTDADGNLITVTANGGIIPPATFVIDSAGSGFTNGTFCFTPTLANAANTYAISINAVDDFCPIPATSVVTFNITVPCPNSIPLLTGSTNASCGLSDGTATASMPGGVAPFAYSWTGPNGFSSSDASISGLAAGSYSITVVDGNSCTGSTVVEVAGSVTPIVISASVSDALCGQSNGSLDLSASGGVAPYTYALNAGAPQSNGQFGSLATGTYTVTVLDVNNCPATETYVINAAADIIPPTALCKNITLYLDANGNVNIAPADVDNGSFDNCNSITLGLNTASFDCSNLGSNNVTLTVTDASNNVSNCTANVTVLDTIKPDLHCQNATLYLDGNGQATLLTSEALHHDHEACQITNVWLSQSSFDCSHLGNNTVTVFATDNSNNEGTCTSIVTVIDNSAPIPDLANLPQVNAECAVSLTAPTATDNCAGVVTATTNDPTTFSAQGTYTVNWTYQDGEGNTASQSQTVVVEDLTPPNANCKSFTLSLSNGAGTVTAADINDNSDDNCGIASMSVSPNTFTCADAGVNTVTLTVTDINGNSSSCTAEVTVQDQPNCSIASVPSNNTFTGGDPNNIYLGYGPQSATLNSTVAGGTGYTYSWSPATYLSCTNCANPVFAPTAAGTITYSLEVTNSNGCTTSCDITMCVIDARATGKGNNGKVRICHVPPGNPGNPQTLSISPSAVHAHLTQHAGDKLGACGTTCGVARGVAIEEGQLLENEGFETIVYPNPTSHEFSIMINSTSNEEIQAALHDITGKKIMDLTDLHANEPYTVNQTLSNGIYLIHIRQNEHLQTVRLIRQD